MFGFGAQKPKNNVQNSSPFVEYTGDYQVPQERAMGRPHELGWLELLDENKSSGDGVLDAMTPGRIIFEDE